MGLPARTEEAKMSQKDLVEKAEGKTQPWRGNLVHAGG